MKRVNNQTLLFTKIKKSLFLFPFSNINNYENVRKDLKCNCDSYRMYRKKKTKYLINKTIAFSFFDYGHNFGFWIFLLIFHTNLCNLFPYKKLQIIFLSYLIY